MGCCIVLLSHRLPGPTGLPPLSEMPQHPCGLPEAAGCSSSPKWMLCTISEGSLCWGKEEQGLGPSERAGAQGSWQHRACAWCCPGATVWGCRFSSSGLCCFPKGCPWCRVLMWRPRKRDLNACWTSLGKRCALCSDAGTKPPSSFVNPRSFAQKHSRKCCLALAVLLSGSGLAVRSCCSCRLGRTHRCVPIPRDSHWFQGRAPAQVGLVGEHPHGSFPLVPRSPSGAPSSRVKATFLLG